MRSPRPSSTPGADRHPATGARSGRQLRRHPRQALGDAGRRATPRPAEHLSGFRHGILVVAVILLVVLVAGAVGLVVPRMRRRAPAARPAAAAHDRRWSRRPRRPSTAPDDDAAAGRSRRRRSRRPRIETPGADRRAAGPAARPAVPLAERLRPGLLSVLSRDHLDDDAWEEIEESLITADVGVEATREIVGRLRERARVLGTRTAAELRALLAEELTDGARARAWTAALQTAPHDGRPAVLLVVGVNGAGKTTTCGKIARVLVADGRTRAARRGRHLPRRRRRPARHLGRAGRRRGGPRARGRRPGQRGVRRGQAGHRHRRGHRADRHRRPAAEQGRPDGRAGQGQAGGGEARPGRRDAARPGRHHRPERAGAGPGVHRGGGRHRRGADQAGRHGQGRHRHRRAAQARHPGQAGRPRRGPGRPRAVRAGRSSSTRCLAPDA